MNAFQKVSPDNFDYSPFRLIGKDWMLITAEKDGKVNSMTAAWGGLGYMWNKSAAFAVIRKSRYTKELIDSSEWFSLTFFDKEKYGKMLSYMGSVSGRDADKVKECGLTVAHYEGIPYYEEASKVLLCRKMCCQPIVPESYTDDSIDGQWYADKDYHDLYIGEVVEILVR